MSLLAAKEGIGLRKYLLDSKPEAKQKPTQF
jgi:hypothetical protein